MPNRLQVSCILRRVSGERVFVEALGGWSSEGTHWWLSPEVAIQGLEGHRWQFYIDGEEGRQIRLVVAEWEGQKYLKAECDDQDPVALLALPECSSARKILENWERSTLQRTG